MQMCHHVVYNMHAVYDVDECVYVTEVELFSCTLHEADGMHQKALCLMLT